MIAPTSDRTFPVGRPTVPEYIARHLDALELSHALIDVDTPVPFTIVPGVIA